MWRNIVERRPQRTMWRKRIACWISKATNTLSEYVILTAFLQQPWLQERIVSLRNAYIAYLASFITILHLNLCTQNTEENNGTVWNEQNTTAFQPNIFLIGVRRLLVTNKRWSRFTSEDHCKGHLQTPQSVSIVWMLRRTCLSLQLISLRIFQWKFCVPCCATWFCALNGNTHMRDV